MTLNRQHLLDVASGLIPASLADDLVVISDALDPINGLSRDVLAGELYRFEITLWLNDSNGEGFQIDLDGGDAGMNWCRATFFGLDDDSVAVISQSVSLATVVSRESFSGMIRISGSFSPSSDGTFIPRIAQLNHSIGALSILKGSSVSVKETTT